jgi:hypothetical protein
MFALYLLLRVAAAAIGAATALAVLTALAALTGAVIMLAAVVTLCGSLWPTFPEEVR